MFLLKSLSYSKTVLEDREEKIEEKVIGYTIQAVNMTQVKLRFKPQVLPDILDPLADDYCEHKYFHNTSTQS